MAPNPHDNPGYFNQVFFGGMQVPGTIVDIRGLKSVEEWVTVRPIAGTGASKIHKGRLPIENIEVEYAINGYTPDDEKTVLALHSKLILFMRGGSKEIAKPKAMDVTNTSFKDVFVRKIVYKGHTAPVWRVGRWTAIVVVDEYQKAKTLTLAPPEAAILNETDPVPTTEGQIALRGSMTGVWDLQSPSDKPPTGEQLSAMYPGNNGPL